MPNFYKCKSCNNIMLEMGDPKTLCKDAGLELLRPNTTDAATEKHVPTVTVENGMVVVRIGTDEHPMSEEHHIAWVYVQTTGGGTYYNLNNDDVPEAIFPIRPEEVEAVYAYCNLHGLWKAAEPVLPNNFVENNVACSPEFPAGCVDPSAE